MSSAGTEVAFVALPMGHAPCATHFQTLQDASGPSSSAPGTALAGTWGLLGSEGHLPNIPSTGEAALCPLPTFPHIQQHLPASSWQRDPPRAGVEHVPRAGDSPACPLPCSMGMETLPGISSPLFSAVTLLCCDTAPAVSPCSGVGELPHIRASSHPRHALQGQQMLWLQIPRFAISTWDGMN